LEFKKQDINVLPVWKRGIIGTGVTIAILDDGVEYTHPDFNQSHYSAESSYDFTLNRRLAVPVLDTDTHGTRCAGEIVAQPNNGVCGVGVAYGSRIAAIRLIPGTASDILEARALSYKIQINDIYSSSWGPMDDVYTLTFLPKTLVVMLSMNFQLGNVSRRSWRTCISSNEKRC
jgi:subtilisin family serine protease